MIRLITLCLLFASAALHANIEHFFKKASHKEGNHSMRNVDFIYMINLDQRPEKFEQSAKQLAPYNIFPYRFSAVNGWDIPLEKLYTLGVTYESWMRKGIWGTYYDPQKNGEPIHEPMREGKTYLSHCLSRGAVGIVLSHLSILQDAFDAGYNTIWVMEDDIEVIRDPHLISKKIDELDATVGRNGWDILFTDPDTKDQNGNFVAALGHAPRPNFTPQNDSRFSKRLTLPRGFRKVGARYGAYSMIVRRSGMEKLLQFIKQYRIFLPFDMDFTMPDNIRLYTVTEEIVSTLPRALSDNGSPAYQNKKMAIPFSRPKRVF